MSIALHLLSACLKALISIAWLTYNIVVATRLDRGYAVNLSLLLVLMMSTVLQVIYGAVMVYKVRKGFYNLSGIVSRKGEDESET
jgi:hypothetical protein